jgi:hypothetical protein
VIPTIITHAGQERSMAPTMRNRVRLENDEALYIRYERPFNYSRQLGELLYCGICVYLTALRRIPPPRTA